MCESYWVNVSLPRVVRLTFETEIQSGANRTLQQVELTSANILKIVNIKESHTLFTSKVSTCVMCSSALLERGTRWWHSWLRYCTTSWGVVVLIPDGVTGILHWHNPSGRTMALGLTQPLTHMSNSWNPQGLSRPIMGLFYLFTFLHHLKGLRLHLSQISYHLDRHSFICMCACVRE